MKRLLLTFACIISLISSSKHKYQSKSKNTYQLGQNLPQDIKLHIQNVTMNMTCAAISPINQIKYNFTKLAQVNHADFCNNYSSRTCCSIDNFNSLRMNFYRQMYMNQDLSVNCQQALQQLICYDCDGDIGQGVRKGICPTQCEQMFDVCSEDYFVIDSSTQNIRICSRQDLMCTKLNQIVTKKTEFCSLLGYEINEYTDYEEWYLQLDSEDPQAPFSEIFSPVCWNFSPSSTIFGNAPLKKKQSQSNQKFSDVYQYALYFLYAMLSIIGILIVLYVGISCLQRRNAQNRGGRRIGGKIKNHHE